MLVWMIKMSVLIFFINFLKYKKHHFLKVMKSHSPVEIVVNCNGYCTIIEIQCVKMWLQFDTY